jgi:Kef-type K+ transport system membrane component KefB
MPNVMDILSSRSYFEAMQMRSVLIFPFFLMAGNAAYAAEGGTHHDPIAPVLLVLAVILIAAKLGGELFERLGLPPVLGELIGGIVLGNLALVHPGWNLFEPLRITSVQGYWAIAVDSLARLGVILLLFEVGLESTVKGMAKVGASSFLVAALGVIAPMLLGFGASWIFIKQIPSELSASVHSGFSLHYIHLFVGSVLCATSVGITARVLKDLGRLQTKEAQIILGAAVIDDVLGLMVLAVVSGIVSAAALGQPMAMGAVLGLLGLSVLFLGGTLTVGSFLVPRIMDHASKLRTSGVMLVSSLVFAFVIAYLADLVGLAPIIGAFAAGLLLEKVHFRGFGGQVQIEELIRPVSTFLVPVFFVTMGIQVRLESFSNLPVLGLAAALTVAAVVGKQVCSLGLLERNLDRISVGIGMIPRGEVGLIFASIGVNLKVVDHATYSALVIMIIVTTLITPPLLSLTLKRKGR